MFGKQKPGTIHLDAARASECGYNPAAPGFLYEVQTKTVRTSKGFEHEIEWEVIIFPEVQDARLYGDKNVVLTVHGRRWEVQVTIDWEDCLYSKGPVYGALIDFIPSDEPETPYIPWGHAERLAAQQEHLQRLDNDIEEARKEAQATHDTFLQEDLRFLEDIREKARQKVEEGGAVVVPEHKALYFGQPVFGSETVTPVYENEAVPLLCCIPTTADARLNIFVAFDAEGQPCKAFFHESRD